MMISNDLSLAVLCDSLCAANLLGLALGSAKVQLVVGFGVA